MVFTKKAALRQLIFILILFALLIPAAIWDSNSQVKVRFDDSIVHVKSDRYTMNIQYSDIASAELTSLAEAGYPVMNSFDNDIIRTGVWSNDAWGEYIIVVDLDADQCIKLALHDGRTLVFSRKNDKATTQDFETLQTYLNP